MAPRLLACNYLVESRELLQAGEVQFDYFKYPSISLASDESEPSLDGYLSFLDGIRAIKPILYHGLYPILVNIGSQDFQSHFDLGPLKAVFEKSQTPGISFHLAGAEASTSRHEFIRTSIDNILFLKQHFPDMGFISAENIENCPNATVTDPKVIAEIVHRSGIYFLLDISHAYRSATGRGESLSNYIGQLPMDCLYEIHVNGWIQNNGRMMAHVKIQEELYDTLKGLLADFPVRIITLEYGRAIDKLGAGIPLVSFRGSNPQAKNEIREQLIRLAEIVY